MSNNVGTKTVESGGSGQDKIETSLIAAKQGDQDGLDILIRELTPVVWHVARANGLDRIAAADVAQTVWLSMLRNIDRLNEPRALAGWLIVTTRREANRYHSIQIEFNTIATVTTTVIEPSTDPSERNMSILWSAFLRLPHRCQELLRLTVLAERAEYRAVAAALHMPHGSIGPTRERCLNQFRALYQGELDAATKGNVPSDISELEFLLDDEPPPPTPSAEWHLISANHTFPVSIYLHNETAHQGVESAIEILLNLAGTDVVERDDPVLGSWFRHMRARVRDSQLAGEVVAVAAHAADVRGVLAHDAAVTATLMQNLGPLLTALDSTKDAVIRVGALLIVKADWVVAVHQLTSVQQLRLDHQPRLLTSPGDILHALDLTHNPPSATYPNNGVSPAHKPGKSSCVDLEGKSARLAESIDNISE
ncbi:hypothetical protein GCM10027436_84960 [Actinophytocola sediminis]